MMTIRTVLLPAMEEPDAQAQEAYGQRRSRLSASSLHKKTRQTHTVPQQIEEASALTEQIVTDLKTALPYCSSTEPDWRA